MTRSRLNKYDAAHRRKLAEIQKAVKAVYDAVIAESVAIAGMTGVATTLAPDKPFSFADYPITQERVNRLFAKMARDLELLVVNGVQSAWTLANNKNDQLCNRVFGALAKSLPAEVARQYYTTNAPALQAFLDRREAGLNLSDRVWHYTDLYKEEIEQGLDYGIRTGCDARQMARDLKTYLREPDKLFRRVRDQWGVLQLSKAAAAYNPGRGVYRSSYKNALRLSVTECNMAYRTADHERWQQLDFVVGQQVQCSKTNHPVPDICDTLTGKYPKDFKFVGWHPFCRCFVIPILKTDEEINEDARRIIRGEEPDKTSANEVQDVPAGFKDWIKDNADRLERAKSKPYFVRDNADVVDGILNPKPRVRSQNGKDYSGKPLYQLDESTFDKNINKLRKTLIRQDREKLMIITPKGGIIKEIFGNTQSVSFDEATAKLIKNNYVTHNHPSGKNAVGIKRFGFSLSSADVFEAVQCNAHGIIAESPSYRYAIYRQNGNWNVNAEVIKKRYGELHTKIKNEYLSLLELHNASNIIQHLVMKQLAKEYGFIYEYTKKS